MKKKFLSIIMATSMVISSTPSIIMANDLDISNDTLTDVVVDNSEDITTEDTKVEEETTEDKTNTGNVEGEITEDKTNTENIEEETTENSIIENNLDNNSSENSVIEENIEDTIIEEENIVNSVSDIDSLLKAIEDAKDNVETTIILQNDIDFGDVDNASTKDNAIIVSCITISENKNIVIDLNGYKIEASLKTDGNDYWNTHVILNNGTLSIIDSSESHTGLINNRNVSSNACTRTIKNAGTLSINGGTIRSDGAVALLNVGNCEINGEYTTIETTKAGVTGGWDNAVAAIENRENGNLVINYATVTSVSQSAIFCNNTLASFTIYDGVFTGSDAYGAFNGSAATTVGTVYGGTWSSDPTMIVANGYIAENVEGRYIVSKVGEISEINVSTEEELLNAIKNATYTEPVCVNVVSDIVLNTSVELLTGSEIIVDSGVNFTIGENAILEQSGVVINNGTLTVDGFLTNPLSLQNNGTISDIPYDGNNFVIDSPMDMQWLTYFVENDSKDWNVTVEKDIVMPEGVVFQAVGSGNNGFYGSTFDGKGHTISGITIRNVSSQTGIFTSLKNSQIKNLTVNVDIETKSAYTGGIVGYAVDGVTFNNITVEGNVSATGTSYGCGGFVGAAGNKDDINSPIEFINCHNKANVGGEQAYNIGGIIGTGSSSKDKIAFYNCSNSGNLVGKSGIGYAIGYGNLQGGFDVINFENKTSDIVNFVGTDSPKIPDTVATTNYAVKDSTGWISIENTDNAKSNIKAEIDGVEYLTVEAAISDAKYGDTVKLLADITNDDLSNTKTISINNNITLDGNGHTINGNVAIYVGASNTETKIENIIFENIHNGNNNLSAIYGSELSGDLAISNCSFKNCDWDAIQITPVEGSKIVITDNIFETTSDAAVKCQRFIHIQSAQNVDFSITATRNKMIGDTAQSAFEVYYPSDLSKVMLNGNYITTANKVCILDGNGKNIAEVAYPMVEKDLVTIMNESVIVKDAYTAISYNTLEDAIKATSAGKEICLIKDISINSEISIPKGVVLNPNGKIITLNIGGEITTNTDISENIKVPSGYRLISSGDMNSGYTYTLVKQPSSSSSSSSSSEKPSSETITEINNEGTKTETIKTEDKTVINIEKTDGTTSSTTINNEGTVKSEINVSKEAVEENTVISLPMPSVNGTKDTETAPVIKVEIEENETAKVEIPVENMTAGTVAVLVKEDGTEEVIKTSLEGENGLLITVEGNATIKVVDNSKDFVDVSSNFW